MSSMVSIGGSEAIKDEEMMVKLRTGLVMTPAQQHQILSYIRGINFECSGLGHVSFKNGTFILRWLNLPEQEGSAAGTELDDGAVSKILEQVVRQGRTEPINFWWHSHVNMEPEWSSIDDDNCSRLVPSDGFLVSVVANKAGLMTCRIDLSKPFRITVDKVPIYIDYRVPVKISKKYEQEVKRKVREQKFKTYLPSYGGLGLSQFRAPMIPRPTQMRSLAGTIVSVEEAFNGNDKEYDTYMVEGSQHVVNCHAMYSGVDCMECIVAGCEMCGLNSWRMNGAGFYASD